MKRLLLPVLTFILFSSLTVAQFPNESFEYWTAQSPDDWTNPVAGFPTITQSTDAHWGQYAVKGSVVANMGSAIPPTLYPTSTNGFGFPINKKYVSVIGWYKADLIADDSMSIDIQIYHSSGLALAFGYKYLPSVSTYTPFTVPITYSVNGPPSFAKITFSMSNLSGSGFHVGSYFLVDDLAFEQVLDVNSINNNSLFTIISNPVSDEIQIAGDFKNGDIVREELINSAGQSVLIKTVKSSTVILPIDVADLPAGLYTLLIADSKVSASKRVLISR